MKERITKKRREAMRLAVADLAQYLNQDFDPWDFMWLLEEYVRSKGLPKDTEFEDVVATQDFRDYASVALMRRGADVFDPAYLLFERARVQPEGEWYVHFSREWFDRFDRGATLEGLALSTQLRKHPTVDCKANLNSDTPLFQLVWGFAVEADSKENQLRELTRCFGHRFVLFQTDFAVKAWHSGDMEWQVIFPLCTERNVRSGAFEGGEWSVGNRTYNRFEDLLEAVI